MTAGAFFFWVAVSVSLIVACFYLFYRPRGSLAREVSRTIRALVPLSLGMLWFAVFVRIGAWHFQQAFSEFHENGTVSLEKAEYFVIQTVTTVGYGCEVLPDAGSVRGNDRTRMLERFYRISSWYMLWGTLLWALLIAGIINTVIGIRRVFSEGARDEEPGGTLRPL